MIVENVRPENYAEMLNVWENSVRATHDFITEEDIEFLNQLSLSRLFLLLR